MPVTAESTPLLPDLSPVVSNPPIARFDSRQLSSDGGLLALREIERRVGIADRLAACANDPRAPKRDPHGLTATCAFAC
jgi:hypothetical protein